MSNSSMVTCTQVTNTFHAHKLKPDLLGISTQNIYNQTSDELFKTIVGEYSIGIFSRARVVIKQPRHMLSYMLLSQIFTYYT